MNPLLRKISAPWFLLSSALIISPVWSLPTFAYELLVSNSPDRSTAVTLSGQETAGNIYVFLSLESGGISQIRFYLDNPSMTGSPRQVENNPTYDFGGGTVTTAKPFDTRTVADGAHNIKALILFTAGGTQTAEASFTVTNTVSVNPDGFFDRLHLAWADDTSTTVNVVWRTLDFTTATSARYRKEGETVWQTATGGPRTSGTTGILHEVLLTGLLPSTRYQYQVMGDGGVWSTTFTTRTAPAPGPADFDAVFVADTGLIGRTDALATGTQQVINEVAVLNPLVVLLGGDYAYFDTDKRYGSLDATIDAWFNQMQPVASQSPMMPTYGNHEALLGENVQSWIDRFPTPDGFDGWRDYSFDIGDVHFVVIFAVQNSIGLDSATLAWIEQDITAAYSAGAHWIVPYFHVAPFSDGTNHPSNLALREQLAPLFERLNVKLVFSAHDCPTNALTHRSMCRLPIHRHRSARTATTLAMV
jgi:hypothetical protein